MRYEFDRALLERREIHSVLARRVYRLQDQSRAVSSALAQGNTVGWIRQELRKLRNSLNEANEALDAFFATPEIALREAVLGWSQACFEQDNTLRADTTEMYRSFQQWSTIHETECCSRERFEELLSQEANVRFRSEGGRLVALGRVTGSIEAA